MIAEDNGKPMPLGKLVESQRATLVGDLQMLVIPLMMMIVFACQTEEPVARGQLKDLFEPELRVTTSLLWFLWSVYTFWKVVAVPSGFLFAQTGWPMLSRTMGLFL
jgi:hypothetical protein